MAFNRWAAMVCSIVLTTIGVAAQEISEGEKTVRISGRLVFPDGGPVSFGVSLSRIEPDGVKREASAMTGTDGVFAFTAARGQRYQVSLAAGGMKTPPKTVDTTSGKDVDLGDMVFEYCATISMAIPRAPTSHEPVGKLRLEQIEIEPQLIANGGKGFPFSTLEVAEVKFSAPELPPCWTGPSVERRSEWEGLPEISFDRHLSVESFVGGTVKRIRVTRYDPQLTRRQVQEEVRKVWLGIFWHAAGRIMWAETNQWNIEASVEYVDGKSSSLLMDGLHVRVQDREGKYWFLRLWPAVD